MTNPAGHTHITVSKTLGGWLVAKWRGTSYVKVFTAPTKSHAMFVAKRESAEVGIPIKP